jgi:hypothetical protein
MVCLFVVHMLRNIMYKPGCMRLYFLYFRKLVLKPAIFPGGTDSRYLRGVSPKSHFVYFEWNVCVTRTSWHNSLILLSCCTHFLSCCISFFRHVAIKLCDVIPCNIVMIVICFPTSSVECSLARWFLRMVTSHHSKQY